MKIEILKKDNCYYHCISADCEKDERLLNEIYQETLCGYLKASATMSPYSAHISDNKGHRIVWELPIPE